MKCTSLFTGDPWNRRGVQSQSEVSWVGAHLCGVAELSSFVISGESHEASSPDGKPSQWKDNMCTSRYSLAILESSDGN